jgi:hypothetical protein
LPGLGSIIERGRNGIHAAQEAITGGAQVALGQVCGVLVRVEPLEALGYLVRNAEQLTQSLKKLKSLSQERSYNLREQNRLKLAEAMLLSALERRESRGAHYREDFPEKDESFRKVTIACRKEEQISITFRNLPERRSSCKSP